MDLVGDLGGVLEVLVGVFSVFVLPFSEHNFKLKILERLYLLKSRDWNNSQQSTLTKKQRKVEKIKNLIENPSEVQSKFKNLTALNLNSQHFCSTLMLDCLKVPKCCMS